VIDFVVGCVYVSVETAAVHATARRRSATKSTAAAVRSQLQTILLNPPAAFTPHTCRQTVTIWAVQVGDTCTLDTP